MSSAKTEWRSGGPQSLTPLQTTLTALADARIPHECDEFNNDHTLIRFEPMGDDADQCMIPYFEFDANGNLFGVGAYRDMSKMNHINAEHE